MTIRREAVSWIVTILAAIVVGFVVVYVTTTAAFASPGLSPLEVASLRQKIADYAADDIDAGELKPLDESLIDEARSEDEALNRRNDERGAITLPTGPLYSLSIIDRLLLSPTHRPTLVVEILPSFTPLPTNTLRSSPTATATNTPLPTFTSILTDTATFTPIATDTSPAAVASPTPTNTSALESTLTRTATSPAIVNPSNTPTATSPSPTRTSTSTAATSRGGTINTPIASATTAATSASTKIATVTPTPTKTTAFTATPTSTKTATFTPTSTPTRTATFTPTATDTLPPVAVFTNTPTQACAIAAGDLGLAGPKALSLSIQNNGNTTVTITSIEIVWAESPGQELKKIEFAGEGIWEGADNRSPSSIPAEGDWKGDVSDRQLDRFSSKDLTIVFGQELKNGGYSVRVNFDNGCVIGAGR
ncbi:MAG: hypothetical protein AABZ58_02020 [Chloroflexota bacterium]